MLWQFLETTNLCEFGNNSNLHKSLGQPSTSKRHEKKGGGGLGKGLRRKKAWGKIMHVCWLIPNKWNIINRTMYYVSYSSCGAMLDT